MEDDNPFHNDQHINYQNNNKTRQPPQLQPSLTNPDTMPAHQQQLNEVVNRNVIMSKSQPVSKAVQLKAENYDLWFQNERLTEENVHLQGELSKVQEKHDKLMSLAKNRLGEIKNKYTNLEQDNSSLKNELDKLIREYEQSKKMLDEYRKLEEKFKISDHDMRIMIDQLTRNNEDLKNQNTGGGSLTRDD